MTGKFPISDAVCLQSVLLFMLSLPNASINVQTHVQTSTYLLQRLLQGEIQFVKELKTYSVEDIADDGNNTLHFTATVSGHHSNKQEEQPNSEIIGSYLSMHNETDVESITFSPFFKTSK